MIKIQDGICTRQSIPAFLRGLRAESLFELSWTAPALGVSDCAWWPEIDESAELCEHEKYGDEILTIDTERNVVIVTHEIIAWTQEEIDEDHECCLCGRKAELAAFRYEKEISGITINGTTILTDRESQATISCAYNSCQINPDMTINFKCSNGWITAESSEIEFIAYTVSNYVQKCFSREKELSDALEEDIDTDITTGWPNNEEESAMVDLVVDYKNLLKLRVKKLQATGEDADAVAALMLIYERNL